MAEVVREIVYKRIEGELEPVLRIKPKVPRAGLPIHFAIRVKDLWMYTPDKNPAFERWMYNVVEHIYRAFDLGIITAQKMAEVATVIEDGIDDLIKALPEPPADSPEDEAQKRFERAFREGMSIAPAERE